MEDENFAGNAKSATDFLGNEWHFDCMGCAIVNGDTPSARRCNL